MWFLCLRQNKRPREERKASLDQHLVWMRARHEDGSILVSGPSQARGLGIYLIRAESEEKAKQIAAGDPFTVAGDTSFELIPWEIHQIAGIGPFTAGGLGHK